jgi:hypothetical protein
VTTAQQIFMVFFAIFWGSVASVQGRWNMFPWSLCGLRCPRRFASGTETRWKHFCRMFVRPDAWRRLLLSFAVLNTVPVVFFCVVFHLLAADRLTGDEFVAPCVASEIGNSETRQTCECHTRSDGDAHSVNQVLAGILPAFAIFGFYRLWVSIVQCRPTWFYREGRSRENSKRTDDDPTIKSLRIRGWPLPSWQRNLWASGFYIFILPCFGVLLKFF